MMVSTITRVTDKKHHVTDVLAGALLGLLFAGAAFALLAEQRCDYNVDGDAGEGDAGEAGAGEVGAGEVDADEGDARGGDAGDANVDGKRHD